MVIANKNLTLPDHTHYEKMLPNDRGVYDERSQSIIMVCDRSFALHSLPHLKIFVHKILLYDTKISNQK
jgi:hypothetical protein